MERIPGVRILLRCENGQKQNILCVYDKQVQNYFFIYYFVLDYFCVEGLAVGGSNIFLPNNRKSHFMFLFHLCTCILTTRMLVLEHVFLLAI